jgi:ABC-type Zn uptake system ZnuABC Zn-binding protein ZnuA
MKGLALKCKDLEKVIITVEPQYPEGPARTLREELEKKGVEVRIVELDPLETASKDELGPDFYEKKVKANIASLLGKNAQ